MSAERVWTADEIEDGINSALHEHKVEIIPSLIRMLAAVDPHRAESVLAAIEVGLAVASRGTEET